MSEETESQTYGNMKLSWPPTDNDFMNVMNSAIEKRQNWDQVLIFVKNLPDLLQYDPVVIGSSSNYQQTFSLSDGDKKYTVILSEID